MECVVTMGFIVALMVACVFQTASLLIRRVVFHEFPFQSLHVAVLQDLAQHALFLHALQDLVLVEVQEPFLGSLNHKIHSLSSVQKANLAL